MLNRLDNKCVASALGDDFMEICIEIEQLSRRQTVEIRPRQQIQVLQTDLLNG